MNAPLPLPALDEIRAFDAEMVALRHQIHAQPELAYQEHATAELVADRSAVQPGQSLQIGLRLQHIPLWHTYWRNPGDSGLPPMIDWRLPAGAQVGEIEWPAP